MRLEPINIHPIPHLLKRPGFLGDDHRQARLYLPARASCVTSCKLDL